MYSKIYRQIFLDSAARPRMMMMTVVEWHMEKEPAIRRLGNTLRVPALAALLYYGGVFVQAVALLVLGARHV